MKRRMHPCTLPCIPDTRSRNGWMRCNACGGPAMKSVRGSLWACLLYTSISASLVVAVELLMQAYAYPLYQQLGIFVPLIVVNCIILGRAEAFAAKNTVPLAIADGLGMGLGFTMSLTFLGSIREVFGAGTLFGTPVMWEGFRPFSVMVEAPGAFLCLGLILAAMNLINRWQAKRKGREEPENISSGCASCGGCSGGKS